MANRYRRRMHLLTLHSVRCPSQRLRYWLAAEACVFEGNVPAWTFWLVGLSAN